VASPLVHLTSEQIIMVTRAEAFPSKYLKAADLPEGGKLFRIAKLEIHKIGPDQEEKYVLFFKGEPRQLVVNLTNWDAIAAFLDAESDNWVGKEVVLFATTTTFGSKTVDCIRVRRPRPQAVQTTVPPKTLTPPPNEDGDPGFAAEDAIQDYRV
jgi:hypothetical protein